MSSFGYRFHADLNLIELHPGGVVEISDILSYSREVLTLDIVTAGTIEYYDFSEMTNLSVDYQSAHALREALRDWLARGWEGSVFFTPRDYQFGMIRMIGAVMESIHGAPSEYMIPSREPIALAEIRNFIDEHRQSSGPG